MKYINVFQTEQEFNNVSNNLSKPQLSLAGNTVYCLNDIIVPETEMVDLGLSVKWMKYNIGSTHLTTSAESWYGNYYAWGETSAKTDYSWPTYTWTDDEGSTMSKYNETDGKEILDTADDAANAVKQLRMPTYFEISELMNPDKIVHSWETNYNGVYGLSGIKFTSANDPTKFMFVPAAGYYDGTTLMSVGEGGGIWTSIVCKDSYRSAYIGLFLSEGSTISDAGRYGGFSVRGVCE